MNKQKFLQEIGLNELIREEAQSALEIEQDVKAIAELHQQIATNQTATVTPLKRNENKNDFSLEKMHNAKSESKEIADKINNLAELKDAVLNFSGCDLKKTCIQTVFSDGNPECEVMIIGEAPGANEDEQGIPFCGMSGKLMDSYLKIIGLTRADNLYISNSVFWRPPGNRKPTELELNICRPFVEKHIALIQPKILVAVGSSPLQSLLPNIKKTITQVRGKFLDYSNPYLNKPLKIFPTFHPSYLLRQPLKKKLVWEDLLSIKKYLDDN